MQGKGNKGRAYFCLYGKGAIKVNYKCEVIEDLLPLYYDGICSRETKIAVEEHIKNCKSCKGMLAEIFYDSTWCNS
ncbi:MAG: zf-HC2 domain-containing protein [Firmicutes bacterium]|nr:zf-HC2 domain-containing protein [Bacillota bacterium]